jgi:peptide/nickel transport system permease protein
MAFGLFGHIAINKIQNNQYLIGSAPFFDLSGYYLLGSDHLGRSMFYQAIYVLHRSIVLGTLSCFIALSIALILSIFSIYSTNFSTITNNVINAYTLFPKIMVLIFIFSIQNEGIFPIILGISLIIWPYAYRILHASFKKIKQSAIVESSKALGLPYILILWNDYLVSSASTLFIVLFKLYVEAIILEASIQFLGFSNSVENINLGGLLHNAVHYTSQTWQMMTVITCLILLTIPLILKKDKKLD